MFARYTFSILQTRVNLQLIQNWGISVTNSTRPEFTSLGPEPNRTPLGHPRITDLEE